MELVSLLEIGEWIWKHFRRKKILLAVEDEPADAMHLREQLQVSKMRYVIASSAEEAIGILKSNRFDAALIDIGLPLMDGTELAEKIKDEYPKTRVFFITGSSFISLKESTLLQIVRKPITHKVLEEMVL